MSARRDLFAPLERGIHAASTLFHRSGKRTGVAGALALLRLAFRTVALLCKRSAAVSQTSRSKLNVFDGVKFCYVIPSKFLPEMTFENRHRILMAAL